jgi:hypothetical protein
MWFDICATDGTAPAFEFAFKGNRGSGRTSRTGRFAVQHGIKLSTDAVVDKPEGGIRWQLAPEARICPYCVGSPQPPEAAQ